MDQLESKIDKIKSPILIDGINYFLTILKVDNTYLAEYKDPDTDNVILSITHTKLQAVIDTILKEVKTFSKSSSNGKTFRK